MASANNVFLPALSKLQGEPERARRALEKTVRSVSYASYPLIAILYVTMPTLVPVLLGPAWTAAIEPAQILCLAAFILNVNYLLPSVWISRGRADWYFRYSLVNGIANALTFAIAAPHGLVAVTSVYVARTVIVTFPMSLFLVNRSIACPPSVILRAISPAAFGTLLMIAVGSLVSESLPASVGGIARLCAVVASCTLVYGVGMLLVGRHGFHVLFEDLATAYPSVLKFRRLMGR